MNFAIPVETYLRLAAIPTRFMEDTRPEEIEMCKCVRLENKSGHCYAISTNRRIAAVFYLGATDQPDGAVHITLDAALQKQCETEKAFASLLYVVTIPAINAISLKTTLGYNHTGNCGYFPTETKLNGWRTWVPKYEILASKGAMKWTLADMLALNAASPSGELVFPEFIDVDQPVVLRDFKVTDWAAMFMTNLRDEKDKTFSADPATVPDWWIV